MGNSDSSAVCVGYVASLLKELNQTSILSEYEERTHEEREQFDNQIMRMDEIYPGGLREYLRRAKILLAMSQNNISPYDNFKVEVPKFTKVSVDVDSLCSLESIGVEELINTGFVLNGGGLGERLGLHDLKIAIPTEIITNRSFLQFYIEHIMGFEELVKRTFELEDKTNWHIPFCILTCEFTHEKTLKILSDNSYFGMKPNQIEIIRQRKEIPSIRDTDCNLVLRDDVFLLETKPHGHGDIHSDLHHYGVVDRWSRNGKKWCVLFQDTNALFIHAIPSALAVSKSNNFVMNTVTIQRKPGEPIGAMCRLAGPSETRILNVEYSHFEPMLKGNYDPRGDVPDEHGFSQFPGNTNILILQIESYNHTLHKTSGDVPEFINPKYSDETKRSFRTSARLECMMQDYPLLLETGEVVGLTMYEFWFCYSNCKHSLNEGLERLRKGLKPQCAFSLEQDIFRRNLILLRDVLGVLEVREGQEKEAPVRILEDEIFFGPKIVILPSFAVTLKELKDKIRGKIVITETSVLVIGGEATRINGLTLDGSLVISDRVVESEDIANDIRLNYEALSESEGTSFELIRGYKLVRNAELG